MAAFLLSLLLTGQAPFESPLGLRFTPPEGFVPFAELAPGPSRAVAPAPPGAAIALLAAYEDTASDPATLALAVVEAPLDLDRGSPERVAALAIDYVRDVLGAELHIEWIERLPVQGGEALELAGQVVFDADSDDPPERVVPVVFVPMGGRPRVVTATCARPRFAALGPRVEAAVSALAFEKPPKGTGDHRAVLWALVGWAVGLLVALTQLLWRRRGVS